MLLEENISNSFISIVCLVSFIIFLIISNFSKLENFKLFLDIDFNKPQAFHEYSVPRIGGLASIISLSIFFSSYNFVFDNKDYSYLFLSISFFILGFLDDIKIKIKPFSRLALMIIIMLLGLKLFNIKIDYTGFHFLNSWLENTIFQYFFLILFFLFIINGSNLIDGFNGLLIIHLIIINSILLYIHLSFQEVNFSLFLTGQIFVMFCFLLFNFPISKMFMGDSGAYLFGVVTSLNVINTSIYHKEISPLFFTCLLFYLFFEVFFSIIRKIRTGRSPLRPDSNHLHMLIFNYIEKNKTIKNSNPITSIIINLGFVLLIIPSVIFRENGLFCKYWFLLQIIA